MPFGIIDSVNVSTGSAPQTCIQIPRSEKNIMPFLQITDTIKQIFAPVILKAKYFAEYLIIDHIVNINPLGQCCRETSFGSFIVFPIIGRRNQVDELLEQFPISLRIIVVGIFLRNISPIQCVSRIFFGV